VDVIDLDDLEEADYLAALQVERLAYGLATVYRFPAIFEMCVFRNNGWLTLPALIPHIDYVPRPTASRSGAAPAGSSCTTL
jgi:hypothetical protein